MEIYIKNIYCCRDEQPCLRYKVSEDLYKEIMERHKLKNTTDIEELLTDSELATLFENDPKEEMNETDAIVFHRVVC